MSQKITKSFEEFFKHEDASGILLMFFAAAALVLANSPAAVKYEEILHYPVTIGFGQVALSKSLLHWINDGLMAVFFFVVGMEIKRELINGELKSFKKAILPIGAALGGMVIPAAFYYIMNRGTTGVSGWGIPMATDIAFALGTLSLLGSKKAPKELAVFLTALAIVDDLGAILVIALFYTAHISWQALLTSLGIFILLFIANKMRAKSVALFLILGLFLWLALLKSGIHATVAGVLLGLTIPARTTPKDKSSMLEWLEHLLEPWSAYVIMPVFALANAGVSIDLRAMGDVIANPVSLGIISGLFLGKQIGIFGTSYLMIRLGIASLPRRVTLSHLYGVSLLGGIGFTMSLFIATLSFQDAKLLATAKISIILVSLLSAFCGLLILGLNKSKEKRVERNA